MQRELPAGGVADPEAKRFDEACASAGAREFGHWFTGHLIEMMRAAGPPL